MSSRLTHFDSDGRAQMVDVSEKTITTRTATARGAVMFTADVYEQIKAGRGKKGDIIAIAEIAGITGAKKTAELIPLCHPLPISGINVEIVADDNRKAFAVTARVKTDGKTGVEMEALTAVSCACLTIYDMTKALDKSMTITAIELVEKTGGKSGDFKRDDEASR